MRPRHGGVQIASKSQHDAAFAFINDVDAGNQPADHGDDPDYQPDPGDPGTRDAATVITAIIIVAATSPIAQQRAELVR